MLIDARHGPRQKALSTIVDAAVSQFVDAGAAQLSLPHLYLGESLLDVYGEDLRTRAFLFANPEEQSELCLRPDFTVPVAMTHGAEGWERPAAYAYHGPVFRRQPIDQQRPVEYMQAGIERFGDSDTTAADISVFVLLSETLKALGVGEVQTTIGDLSIPFALLDAMVMPDGRRAALRRHFWRHDRFQALIARAVKPVAQTELRQSLLSATDGTIQGMIGATAELVGIRTSADVKARIASLGQEAREPSMPAADAALLTELLSISGPPRAASDQMRQVTSASGYDLSTSLDRFDARLDGLAERGVAVDDLSFDAAFGRTLEYYDGFVFEISVPGGGGHPPLAGGGRYDSLMARLGAPAWVPAIGGIIRPDAVLDALS